MIDSQSLAKISIFDGLTSDELGRVAALCQERVYDVGATVHEEGGSAEHLYVVKEGRIALEMALDLEPYATSKQIAIDVVAKGEAFGWSSLVEPHASTLSARCVEKARVLAFNGSALLDLFNREPRIGCVVMERIATLVASRLRETRRKLTDFTRGGELAQQYTPAETTLVERMRLYIVSRWIAAAGIALFTPFVSQVLGLSFPVLPVYVIAIFLVLYNTVVTVLARNLGPEKSAGLIRKARQLVIVQTVTDLLVLTVLVHYTGGIETPLLFFFVFHTICASLLLLPRSAYLVTTLAVVLVFSLTGLEYIGVIPHIHLGGFVPPDIWNRETHILVVLFAFAAVLYVCTYMSTSIAKELRGRQQEVVSLRDRLLREARALEQANKKLVELDRLRLFFLAMVAHDLRTPLVAVGSYLDAILYGSVGEIQEEQRRMLERSRLRIGEMATLTRDLLDVSCIDAERIAAECEALSLAEVIDGALEDLGPMASEKDVVLRADVPDDLAPVHAAPQRLRQVLDNLLHNAVKFTPPRGLIGLRVEDKGDHLQVDVSDTGVGIPPEHQPHIFDEFFRGHTYEKTGKGLGLAIAKKIVEAHGGRIWVQSPCTCDGQGTRISFTLPKQGATTQVPPSDSQGSLA